MSEKMRHGSWSATWICFTSWQHGEYHEGIAPGKQKHDTTVVSTRVPSPSRSTCQDVMESTDVSASDPEHVLR